jgi:hypothetical protein
MENGGGLMNYWIGDLVDEANCGIYDLRVAAPPAVTIDASAGRESPFAKRKIE